MASCDDNVKIPQEVHGESSNLPAHEAPAKNVDNCELAEVVVVPDGDLKVVTIPTIIDTRAPQYYRPVQGPVNRLPEQPPSYEEATQSNPSNRRDQRGEQPPTRQWFQRSSRDDGERGGPWGNENTAANEMLLAFQDKIVRQRFVQRVYSILTVQLIVTFGFIVMSSYIIDIKIFMIRYYGLAIGASIGMFVLSITLTCYKSVGRSFPLNFILLGLLTACMAYIAAFVSLRYRTHIVLGAIGLTAIVCFLVSIFACQTKWDITTCGCCLCIAGLVLMVFGLVLSILLFFMPISRTVFLVYSCLATLLFTMYLMYDTQQIVGGRRYELSTDDYIYGAMTLFMDVIMFFMYVLEIVESCGC